MVYLFNKSRSFVLYLTVFIFLPFCIQGQDKINDLLKQEIMGLDKMLFKAVFEDCDSIVIDQLLHTDCIFYHDQSGIIPDKASFIKNIKDGLCNLEYKATRELDEASVEIFPLYQQGALYGVIQQGTHRFYAQYKSKPGKELTSVAKFSHLWLKNEHEWQLVNILSYDHKAK